MAEPFYEDFFERVINVKWETEPEVFWMAGSGNLAFVNGQTYGDQHAWLFTSDDGKSWAGQDIGIHSYMDYGPGSNQNGKPWGFATIVGGCWMREGLKAGGTPVWVLGGGDGKFRPGSAVFSSRDGKFPDNAQYFDHLHVVDGPFFIDTPGAEDGSGGGSVGLRSKSTLNGFDMDTFTSSDGTHWTPSNYHPRTGGT